MNTLVLYDDEAARGFEPFALTRPVSELRAGTEVVRRRWETALGAEATGFIGAAHLADFDELDAPPCITGPIAAGTILVNARCAPVLAPADPWADVWTCHVLEGIRELDFLGDGDAVLGDGRGAELLVDDDIPALGAEGDLHRLGELVDTALQGSARVGVEMEFLGSHMGVR